MAELAAQKSARTLRTVSEESAQAQLDAFMEYYDIELDDLPGKASDGIKAGCKKIVRAIMNGRLTIDASGETIAVVQFLQQSELKYAELGGPSKVAMKEAGEGDHYSKVYCLVGSLTSVGETGIRGLKGKDLGLAESLGALYLQA